MLVMGIDPGIAITGVSVIEENKGKVRLISYTALTTPKSQSPPERLKNLYTQFMDLIKPQKPEVAALETLIFNTNVTTAFAVGQARGVIILALSQSKIPVFEFTPVQVKMALTGYGKADKNQIQQMVKIILKLPQILKPDDVADAAAIALTHCFSYKMNRIR